MVGMPAAGLILTGGRSRRMGSDKAALPLPTGGTLACHIADLLEAVTSPALEVGPGYTQLARAAESSPGSGPLRAMVAGYDALERLDWKGSVVVVATDLPNLSRDFLAWLVDVSDPRSAIPVAGGRPQPLCARYSRPALQEAVALSGQGRLAMHDLLERIDARLLPEAEWPGGSVAACTLFDVDTPADLAAAFAMSTLPRP
jgi:molybdenum cofactor guanylyltransferase